MRQGVDINISGDSFFTQLIILTSFFLVSRCRITDKTIAMTDNFGNTPLLEALKNGNDRVAELLYREGAIVDIKDAGSFLCSAVARGDTEFVKRVLANGLDPNSRDYDHRTPLHVASSQGLYVMAKVLIEGGADVFLKDR